MNNFPVDSLFRMVDLGGGLLGVPSFNTDQLYIVDARRGMVSPPPFYAPLKVGAGPPVLDGLQVVVPKAGSPGRRFRRPGPVCALWSRFAGRAR